MAYDGIAVSNIVYELKEKLIGGRIDKIYQPRNDEIIFSVRSVKDGNFKVLVSANSMNPRIHITEIKKENPVTAPMFCMVLRKHIAGGRILDIRQPGFERITEIDIESMNEMGDLGVKRIIAEFMGKYSNIILVDENGRILDSIKHVTTTEVPSGRCFREDYMNTRLHKTNSIRWSLILKDLKKSPRKSRGLISRGLYIKAIRE